LSRIPSTPTFALGANGIVRRSVQARIEIRDEKNNKHIVTFDFQLGIKENDPRLSAYFKMTPPIYTNNAK
jgi:hypothetical protein